MPTCKFISLINTAINNINNVTERKIVAEELGVGLSTIVRWMKDEKNIIENSKIVNSKNVKKIKLSPYDDVENPLLIWFAAILILINIKIVNQIGRFRIADQLSRSCLSLTILYTI